MDIQDQAKKKDGILKSYLAKKYDQLLDSIVLAAEDQIVSKSKKREVNTSGRDHTSNIAASGEGGKISEPEEKPHSTISNKELLQHVASSLLNTSIDSIRLERESNTGVESSTLNETIDVHSDIPSAVEKDGFLDIFLEKLLSRIVTDKLPEREHFSDLDEEAAATLGKAATIQAISPAILASNLGRMTGQMNSIFEFQDSFIRLLTWKTPSTTIMTLLIITLIFYYPLYLILLPLIYIAYGIITPNYNKKYQLKHFKYHLKKTYGKSLLTQVTSGRKRSKPIIKPILEQLNDNIEDMADWEDVNNGVQVITNIRDFQNMTTNTLHLTDSISKFIHETAAFKDERKTTVLFLKCISSYFILKCISPWVNWKLLFSSLVWFLFLSLHPKLKPKLKTIKTKFSRKDPLTNTERDHVDTNEKNIIIDPSPRVREIEIFEIYRKGLIPGEWKFFLFSTNVFDYNDEFRKAQKPPPGVKSLDQVIPPKSWEFDRNSKWKIDYNVLFWAQQRRLLDLDVENEFLCDGMFKRRRWIRKVLK